MDQNVFDTLDSNLKFLGLSCELCIGVCMLHNASNCQILKRISWHPRPHRHFLNDSLAFIEARAHFHVNNNEYKNVIVGQDFQWKPKARV